MVKMGESSGSTSEKEAIEGFSHHFNKYKNFRAVQIDSKYKVEIKKKKERKQVNLFLLEVPKTLKELL